MSLAYLLDTNIASEFIRSRRLDDKISAIPVFQLAISSITESEILYGLAKKPDAVKLQRTANLFLESVEVLAFDSPAARSYGWLRKRYEQQGLSVGTLDGLIAAHAHALELTLVTRDAALLRLQQWLKVERW